MPSKTRIKVCGMRQSRNISELIDLAPDFIGFIFYERSPRYAGTILTPDITSQIPAHVKKTGVFVNAPLEHIIKTCEKYNLNTVQLHGEETPQMCRDIQNKGYEVIKSFALKTTADLEQTTPFADCCDFFLFDTPTAEYGGSGKKFDWSVLHGTKIERPFFLSGGIEEADAATILDECPQKPYALDINSKFETAPGLKNIESVGLFMDVIRTNKPNK